MRVLLLEALFLFTSAIIVNLNMFNVKLADQTENQSVKTVVFFGDSLTAGYGLALNQTFPALIQQKIDSNNLSYKVVNAGLSGETSAGGKTRIISLPERNIDVFVLELGINDILRGITPAETTSNLQFIIEFVKIKHPKAKMMILGMELPSFFTGHTLTEFRMIFRNLAEKNQMLLMPFLLHGVAGNRLLNLADGVHPNAKGYEIIAGNLWPILKTIL